jgi:uncharacterized membrane protein
MVSLPPKFNISKYSENSMYIKIKQPKLLYVNHFRILLTIYIAIVSSSAGGGGVGGVGGVGGSSPETSTSYQ